MSSSFGKLAVKEVNIGVFSHAQGFTSLNDLWAPMAFHTVSMGLDVFCMGRATALAAGKPLDLAQS